MSPMHPVSLMGPLERHSPHMPSFLNSHTCSYRGTLVPFMPRSQVRGGTAACAGGPPPPPTHPPPQHNAHRGWIAQRSAHHSASQACLWPCSLSPRLAPLLVTESPTALCSALQDCTLPYMNTLFPSCELPGWKVSSQPHTILCGLHEHLWDGQMDGWMMATWMPSTPVPKCPLL